MKIYGDKLFINDAEVDSVGGAKPEPEERPVIRSMETAVHVGVNNGPGVASREAAIGRMRSSINNEDTAGAFFDRAKPCSGCIHFRNDLWLAFLAKWKSSNDPVEKAELNRARAQFISPESMKDALATGEDLDAVLQPLGQCMAYTQLLWDLRVNPRSEVVFVHPLSTCPASDPKGNQLPKLYKANPNALINKIRDDVLFKADGKKR